MDIGQHFWGVKFNLLIMFVALKYIRWLIIQNKATKIHKIVLYNMSIYGINIVGFKHYAEDWGNSTVILCAYSNQPYY